MIVVLAACSNSYTLVDGSDGLRQDSALVRADLRAVALAGNRLPANFRPVPVDAPQILVGPYLEAVAALGSPADSYAQLLAAPEDVRASADGLLILAVQPAVKSIEKASAAHRGLENSADLMDARCTSKTGGVQAAKGQLQLGLPRGPIYRRSEQRRGQCPTESVFIPIPGRTHGNRASRERSPACPTSASKPPVAVMAGTVDNRQSGHDRGVLASLRGRGGERAMKWRCMCRVFQRVLRSTARAHRGAQPEPGRPSGDKSLTQARSLNYLGDAPGH